jgi:hypothetical protein
VFDSQSKHSFWKQIFSFYLDLKKLTASKLGSSYSNSISISTVFLQCTVTITNSLYLAFVGADRKMKVVVSFLEFNFGKAIAKRKQWVS